MRVIPTILMKITNITPRYRLASKFLAFEVAYHADDRPYLRRVFSFDGKHFYYRTLWRDMSLLKCRLEV